MRQLQPRGVQGGTSEGARGENREFKFMVHFLVLYSLWVVKGGKKLY